jgi:tetratricopeptide (TPR) repeat protein
MADKQRKESDLTVHQAIDRFERAVKENPQDAQARLNLGSGYYAGGNWDAALKEFQQAAALAPSLDHAHYYLGVLYARRGEKDTARQELEKVLNGAGHNLLKNQAKLQLGMLGN